MPDKIVVLLTSAVAAILLGIMTLAIRVKKNLKRDITTMIQELVTKMKEYDLDTRAGLFICEGNDLRIQYMDSALKGAFGTPTCVSDLLPESFRNKHRQLVARFVGPQPLPDTLSHPL